MQGIELSRKFYESYGKGMIKEKFPEYENRIAVGISGPGSECLGFDDDISRDHDFSAGFCLWLTEEDYEKIGASLQAEYDKLPTSFEGVKNLNSSKGGSKYGVKTISGFFSPLIGSANVPESNRHWLSIPDYALACATDGEIFRDDLGEFTKLRNTLIYDMPEDVRLKKIAAKTIAVAQSGQYNFPRCISHGEYGAAALALSEFAKSAAALAYLLSGKYCPFYKWAIKGLSALTDFSHLENKLNRILTMEINEKTSMIISGEIAEICYSFASFFRTNSLSKCVDNFLEPHAYEIADKIKDNELRSLHIMEG